MAQSSERHVHLAVDGKALRGTGKQAYGGEKPQKQVLHGYEAQTGIVLQQCPIAQEHNEVSTLKPWLTEVLCKGRIITTDAAQSYHDFGRLVKRAGGDVVLFIKENTPATRADLELFFEDPEADRRTWQSYAQIEKGHGRLERRQITTSPDRNRLSALIRAHWAVENRLHWRRDATLGEDRCGVRFPPVAQMLAVLNSVVLSLMDLHQVPNVARQLRRFASHPHEALAWVLDF